MLKSPFIRVLAASICAWPLVLFGMAAIWSAGTRDFQELVDGSIVVVSYGSVIYGGWWFVDAILMRPLLVSWVGWAGLVPIEYITLCAYDLLPRWKAMVRVGGMLGIVHEVEGMSVFYAGYLAVSVLLFCLLSRLADCKTPPPDS